MVLFKKIWNIATTVIVALAVLCAVFLVGSRLLGYRVFTVISGSMEPEYSVGDLLYVRKMDPADVKVGDPITFVLNEDGVVATHRVIRIDAQNQHFYTKGDANEIPDAAPVHFNNFYGVPAMSIPVLGYVSDFIQHPPGTYITVGVGAVLILLAFLPIKGKEQTQEEQESADAPAEEPAEAPAEQ